MATGTGEFAVRLRIEGKHRAFRERVLGRMTRRIQHEVRPVLADELRGAIDQPARLWFNAYIQGVALAPCPLCNTHEQYLHALNGSEHIVMTVSLQILVANGPGSR